MVGYLHYNVDVSAINGQCTVSKETSGNSKVSYYTEVTKKSFDVHKQSIDRSVGSLTWKQTHEHFNSFEGHEGHGSSTTRYLERQVIVDGKEV